MNKPKNLIALFSIIFLLNILYTFFISPYGIHDIYGLKSKYSGQKYQEYIHADARDYIYMGINIANGKGLSFPIENARSTAKRMPGYPLFLSGIFKLFGVDLEIALVVQCILLTIFIFFSYMLAKELFSDKVAFISLLLIGICPNIKFYGCAYLGSETLAGVFFLMFLYLFSKEFKNTVELQQRVVSGSILFALSVYIRPDFIIFVPFFILWLLKKKKYLIKTLVSFLVILLLSLSPWILRNYKLFNHFVPLTTAAGSVLAGSYNPDTIAYNPGGWDTFGLEKSEDINEVEENQLKTEYAVEQMKSLNLAQITKLITWKMIRLWFPVQRVFRTNKGLVNVKALLKGGKNLKGSLLMGCNILFTLFFLPLYIFFWLGLVKLIREGRQMHLLIMLFFYMNSIALVFWGSLRLRFIFEPMMIISACWYLIEKRNERRRLAGNTL
ncbi:MAG: hypothetical protein D3924_11530 [Candidatus Electrothrix sp. AR4]|nr:hypothetical protein [Candidatus Electrothrix sp. AR4]